LGSDSDSDNEKSVTKTDTKKQIMKNETQKTEQIQVTVTFSKKEFAKLEQIAKECEVTTERVINIRSLTDNADIL
jgi:hypothetical protein